MKLKLAAKLVGGFGIVLAVMSVSAVISLLQSQKVRAKNDKMFSLRYPEIESSYALQRELASVDNRTRQIILAGNDSEKLQEARKGWEEDWTQTNKDLAEMTEMAPRFTLQANRDLVHGMEGQLPKLREIQQKCIDTASQGTAKSTAEAGSYYADIGTPYASDIRDQLVKFVDSIKVLVAADQVSINAAIGLLSATLAISSLIGIVVGLTTAILLSRRISSSTARVLRKAESIASGDLSGEEVKVVSQDELGDLATAMNAMQASLRQVIQGISENALSVANASEEFSATSQQITANSEETSAQANSVSSATEQVNRNLHTVATGTEQMSTSISEIAKNATEAARVAASAMETANRTNVIVAKLGQSSEEIGQVLKTITSIAQKTDLLALNATVEAARAGEVGAGFAVVANEVKELAKQTSNATEDISRKIEAIQTDARAAVTAIGTISSIIQQVNEISGTIAAAVEEQSATTSEMSRSLTEAAKGSGEVGQNIQSVAQAAQNTSHGANDSLKAAQQLAVLSNKLRTLVDQFKLQDTRGDRRASTNRKSAQLTEREPYVDAPEEVYSR